MRHLTTFIFILGALNVHGNSLNDTTVYLFLLEDCVICQSMSAEMNELDSIYGDRYPFIGLFPNKRSKYKSIDEFKEKYGIHFTTKTDHYKSKTKKFNAQVTPEVVIYDEQSQQVIYQGAFSDEFVRIGKRRRVTTRHYLQEALAYMTGHGQSMPENNEAIGCFINFKE